MERLSVKCISFNINVLRIKNLLLPSAVSLPQSLSVCFLVNMSMWLTSLHHSVLIAAVIRAPKQSHVSCAGKGAYVSHPVLQTLSLASVKSSVNSCSFSPLDCKALPDRSHE